MINKIEIASNFLIRASAIHRIMANKHSDELPVGAITYLEEYLLEKTIALPLPSDNKYCLKGTRGQETGRNLIMEAYPEKYPFLVPCPKRVDGEFITGEWDYSTPDGEEILDVKCSWMPVNFPRYKRECPQKGYEWQVGAGYCSLKKGAKRGTIAYVLLDATETEIEREVGRHCYINDIEETEEIHKMFRSRMTFPHLSPKDRIKLFHIDAMPSDTELVHKRVQKCRVHLLKLLNEFH